jgi:hypothetical protein
LGGTAKVAATITNAEATDIRISNCRQATAREDAIGSVNELLASRGAIEFIIVTATPSNDERGKKTQYSKRKGPLLFLDLHDVLTPGDGERYSNAPQRVNGVEVLCEVF